MKLFIFIESLIEAVWSLVKTIFILAVIMVAVLGMIFFAVFYFNVFVVVAVVLLIAGDTRKSYIIKRNLRNRNRRR